LCFCTCFGYFLPPGLTPQPPEAPPPFPPEGGFETCVRNNPDYLYLLFIVCPPIDFSSPFIFPNFFPPPLLSLLILCVFSEVSLLFSPSPQPQICPLYRDFLPSPPHTFSSKEFPNVFNFSSSFSLIVFLQLSKANPVKPEEPIPWKFLFCFV